MSLSHMHPCVLYLVVCLCMVIRVPLMFGNVRACTYVCLVLREDRSWWLPWLSPWIHHFWWICGYDPRPGRGIQPPFWTRGLWSNSAVSSAAWPQIWNRRFTPDAFIFSGCVLRFNRRFRNRRMKPPFSPLFSGWILRLWSAAWPPNETAELDILGRFPSRVQFGGQILRPRPQNETADWAFPGAILSFHMPCFWCI